MSKKVRLAFEGGNITNMVTKFIITLPDLSSHVNHELGEVKCFGVFLVKTGL